MFIYLIIINLFNFLLCIIDKYLACHKKNRIKETTLFLISTAGGCLGFLIGMYLVRHKTKKKRFVIGIPIICILWFIVLINLI